MIESHWLLKINPIGSKLDETHRYTSPRFAHEAFEQSCNGILNIEVWLLYFMENPHYPGHVMQYIEDHWHRSEQCVL